MLLVECGPGRGTLMVDALRWPVAQVAACVRGGTAAASGRDVAAARALQAEHSPGAVCGADRLDVVLAGPMLPLANEFLDALPIRQFVRREAGWMERFVAAGGSSRWRLFLAYRLRLAPLPLWHAGPLLLPPPARREASPRLADPPLPLREGARGRGPACTATSFPATQSTN